MLKNEGVNEKVKFSIGAKLITIISILVVFSLGTITGLVTWFVGEDIQTMSEESNRTVNFQAGAAAEKELLSIKANAFLFLDVLNSTETGSGIAKQTADFYFERNPQVADEFIENEMDTAIQAEKGIEQVINASPFFGEPILVLFYPYREKGLDQGLVIFFSAETLSENIGTGKLQTTYLVNNLGDILIHPDFELTKNGINISDSKLFIEMREKGDMNRQILFTDKEGKKQFGAYRKISIADLAVLTTAEADKVLEPVVRSTFKNVTLGIAVLALAVLFIWFFSKSISSPVKALASAAGEIEQGNYELDLKAKTKDEIGLLTNSFVRMGKGLAERERLKDSFGRFINKEIAELAMKGELALGGETKETTIFFSDIRSFTAISEKLEPNEVVEFLNEYMTQMVECVNDTHGVVDKFIGDAVMAVWGAPTSAGNPREDALNCIRAALRMRAALIIFNQGRGGDKKPIIRIGCGINSGPVVAGQIGSKKRMEYTVIGDAVNLASRTEALNKPLGTDILITENTYRLVKDKVLVEEMPSVTVKGKSAPLRMFAVINMPEETGIPGAGEKGPKTLAQIRVKLGIPTPDLNKVDVNEDEKKYDIQSQNKQ